jgi:predicted membrane-bound spermidine synthase
VKSREEAAIALERRTDASPGQGASAPGSDGPEAAPRGLGAGRRGPPLELLVFVVGAASLGAEIAAARLMAPFFGASTVVWANTIATVLVALSLGYWLGGRLADRHPHARGLGLLTLTAAALLGLVPLIARPFLDLSVDAFDALSIGAFAGSLAGVLALIALPVMLLGAATPWAIRLRLERVEESGRTSGRLYAISTVGALAGTFLAALVLIPLIGTRGTFLVFALALAIVAVAVLGRARYLLVALALAAVLALPARGINPTSDKGRVIHETETTYQYARVVQHPDGSRRLELNEGRGVHSMYVPGTVLTDGVWDGFLVLPFASRRQPPSRIAILGNAAGTTARAYGHYFPATRVDGVEIDGRLHEIGKRFFGLRERAGLRLVTDDARPFLRRARGRYDAIFVDAYHQQYIPFYLATREFFELVDQRLAPGGVVIVDVAHPEGSTSLERVLTATLRTVFPTVVRDPIRPRNTLLLASRGPAGAGKLVAAAQRLAPELANLARLTAARLGGALSGGSVYTDDRAPVEWLIDRSIVAYTAGGGGE